MPPLVLPSLKVTALVSVLSCRLIVATVVYGPFCAVERWIRYCSSLVALSVNDRFTSVAEPAVAVTLVACAGMLLAIDEPYVTGALAPNAGTVMMLAWLTSAGSTIRKCM